MMLSSWRLPGKKNEKSRLECFRLRPHRSTSHTRLPCSCLKKDVSTKERQNNNGLFCFPSPTLHVSLYFFWVVGCSTAGTPVGGCRSRTFDNTFLSKQFQSPKNTARASVNAKCKQRLTRSSVTTFMSLPAPTILGSLLEERFLDMVERQIKNLTSSFRDEQHNYGGNPPLPPCEMVQEGLQTTWPGIVQEPKSGTHSSSSLRASSACGFETAPFKP